MPAKFDLYKFLLDNNFNKIRETSGGFLACCPFPDHPDSNPSWAIFNDPPYNYTCFGCHRSGTLRELKETLSLAGYIPNNDNPNNINIKDNLQDLKSKIIELNNSDKGIGVINYISLPKDFCLVDESKYRDKVYKYLKYRNVLNEYLLHRDMYRFGTSDSLPYYMIMPIFEDGKCMYWTSRSIRIYGDKSKRFKNPPNSNNIGKSHFLYNPYLPKPSSKKGLIVEGQFDVMNMLRFGLNTVGTFNASPSDIQIRKIIKLFNEITIFYDNDNAGNTGASILANNLKEFGVNVYRAIPLRAKDPGAYNNVQDLCLDLKDRIKL